MQSSFGCEAGRGGLRKGGMWVRSGEDKGGGGTRKCVDGWEVWNKSGAVQWCSAVRWEAHFSCVVRPRTGRVIRATHAAPLHSEGNRRRRKELCHCLLWSWVSRSLQDYCWWALAFPFPPPSLHLFFLACLSSSLPLSSALPSFLFSLPWILIFLLVFIHSLSSLSFSSCLSPHFFHFFLTCLSCLSSSLLLPRHLYFFPSSLPPSPLAWIMSFFNSHPFLFICLFILFSPSLFPSFLPFLFPVFLPFLGQFPFLPILVFPPSRSCFILSSIFIFIHSLSSLSLTSQLSPLTSHSLIASLTFHSFSYDLFSFPSSLYSSLYLLSSHLPFLFHLISPSSSTLSSFHFISLPWILSLLPSFQCSFLSFTHSLFSSFLFYLCPSFSSFISSFFFSSDGLFLSSPSCLHSSCYPPLLSLPTCLSSFPPPPPQIFSHIHHCESNCWQTLEKSVSFMWWHISDDTHSPCVCVCVSVYTYLSRLCFFPLFFFFSLWVGEELPNLLMERGKHLHAMSAKWASDGS